MQEPYLQPLIMELAPRILKKSGKAQQWISVPAECEFNVRDEIAKDPARIGTQLEKRKQLRPLLSLDQERLCALKMDGKPRLVRGVAGSGKTLVLAHWLVRTMQEAAPESRLWVVFANRALQKLISDTIEVAWKSRGANHQFPWDRVEFWHIKDLLSKLLPETGMRMAQDEFDYDAVAASFLDKRPIEQIAPRCHAMFIDEAQDMGPNALKLLSALVTQVDSNDAANRAMNIFYDNAQNIFGRSTPKWSELGLDMRGRSTVMKESFRSTRPITEFALNVLYKLQPPEADADHKELMDRGLIESEQRNGHVWWNVRFNQVDGPSPMVKKFDNLDREFDAVGNQIVEWIRDEGVKPSDICVIYNNKRVVWRLEQQVAPKLKAIGVKLLVQTGKGFTADAATVTVTTSHSFKGYDAEVVVIPGVDQFVAGAGILANNLYVAMTRARSMLAIYGLQKSSPDGDRMLSAMEQCLNLLVDRPAVEMETSRIEDFEEIVARLGHKHRQWLDKLWKKYNLVQEPIRGSEGEIIGEPLFWFKSGERVYACFGNATPGQQVRNSLSDAGIPIIQPGTEIP